MIDAVARGAGELGETQCTVKVNGKLVVVQVPDKYRYETAASPARLVQLGVSAPRRHNIHYNHN